MSTVRVPITDKNGIQTSRHKRTVDNVVIRSIPSSPPAPSRLIPSEAARFAKEVMARIPRLKLELEGDDTTGEVVLGVISIPFAERNKGLGTQAMKEVIAKADDNGWVVTLTPSQTQVSEPVLLDFYSRFGFTVHPEWDAEAYEANSYKFEQMIRYPQER